MLTGALGELDQVIAAAEAVARSGAAVRRVFLADGDAMTLSIRRLKLILQAINRFLPDVQRVSS